MTLQLPPAASTEAASEDGQRSPTDGGGGDSMIRRGSRRRGSHPSQPQGSNSPTAEGVELKSPGVRDSGFLSGFLTGKRQDPKADGNGNGGSADDPIAPAPIALPDLSHFVEKYGLNPEASEELGAIFSTSYKKLQAQLTAPAGPRYRWDQIHEMIETHSPDTSLVIVNLPDPPELGADKSADDQRAEYLDYMNYMEGVAENLPRVLYVHGSGQEVINLDALA